MENNKVTTMQENHSNSNNIKKIFELVLNSATTAMKHTLKSTDADLATRDLTPNEDLSYDHWVCCIAVAFKGFAVTFSVHFGSKMARHLASVSVGKASQELNPQFCHDFMREYCNVTAGLIKEKLRQCNFEVADSAKVMLPVQEPSFDIVKLDDQSGSWLSNWILSYMGQSSLICSAKVQVENPAVLVNLEKLDNPAILIDDTGDVDFF